MWVVCYGLIAISFLAACFRKHPKILYWIGLAISAYFVVISAPSFVENLLSSEFDMAQESMNPEKPQIEITREFFGALIGIAALGFLWWQARKISYSDGSPTAQ